MDGAFMFLLKSCPRCRGDLNVSLEGELVCLQCGHEVPRDLAKQMIAERAARASRTTVAAKAA
jgi:uncharacterized Zn finger protein (UPF0148 family)